MIAAVLRVACILYCGVVLVGVTALAVVSATDAAAQRAAERNRRAADVALARARQLPARIVCHADGCLTPDESYQWVEIVNAFGPRGNTA